MREAALTLFAERGYHGTALSEVAGLLSIARWFCDDGPLSPAETAEIHATFALRIVGHRS